jgi:DNA polymerase III delta prime subunit
MTNIERNLEAHKALNENDAQILTELSRSRSGERPISLLALIERGTFDLELAAWLMSHVSQGASYIIGAGPGGVGKTTTMRALLSVVPGNRPFGIALPGKIADTFPSPHCVISHELSDHRPPGYLWGQDLCEFFALSEQGHTLVGNMHVDDLDEAHAQICESNGVPESQFRAVNLFAFVRVEGEDHSVGRINNPTAHRFINEIFYSDGTAPHKRVFTCDTGLSAGAPRDAAHAARCRAFLDEALAGTSRTIEEIRRLFLASEAGNGRTS